MVIDFQHHYIPVEIGQKARALLSASIYPCFHFCSAGRAAGGDSEKISAELRWLGASVDPCRHRGVLIQARLVLLTPMRVVSTAFRQPEKLSVLAYRSTAGLAKLAST